MVHADTAVTIALWFLVPETLQSDPQDTEIK